MKDRRQPSDSERRLRDMNAELLASSVRQQELTETAERAEEGLRVSEGFVRTLVDSAPHGFYAVDREGRTTLCNKAFLRMLGFARPEDVLGIKLHDQIHHTHPDGSHYPKEQCPIYNAAGGDGSAMVTDELFFRTDGTSFAVQYSADPILRDAQVQGAICNFIDITERKRMEEALKKSRDELEDRVIERTAELAEAHQALEAESAEREKVQEERLILLKQILTVQEDERRSISRDMHDHFGQQLTALRLSLDAMNKLSDPDALREKIAAVQQMAASLDSDVNFLVWELRPTALDDLGLKAAVEHYVRKWSEQFNIPAAFHGREFDDRDLGVGVATQLYRIAQECLNNTAKHARANHASVIIEKRNSKVVMIVEDDGQGFDTTIESRTGLGLKGMFERAELVGGSVEFESKVGNGTTIYVKVPLKLVNRES